MNYDERLQELLKESSRYPQLNLNEKMLELVSLNKTPEEIYNSLKPQTMLYIRLNPRRGLF